LIVRLSRRCARGVIVGLTLLGCAKQAAPPGGPVDLTPPHVEATAPVSGSVRVPLQSPVTIQFSEAMDRREVERALYIFPAPPAPPDLSWAGAALSIEPDTAWEADQTYIITLQVEARDRRGNRLASSRQIAFSTGVQIDSGKVSGTIMRSLRPQAGATALCYRLDDTPPNPELDTADYVVLADAEGQFEFEFLSPGTYRVFALEDRDRDWLWNVGSEWIGVPSADANLSEAGAHTELPPLHLTALDTVRAIPTVCRNRAGRFVRVEFDRATDAMVLSRCDVTVHGAQIASLAANRVYVLDTLATSLWAEFADLPTAAQELVVQLPGPQRRPDTCVLEATFDATPPPIQLERIDPDTTATTVTAIEAVYLTFDSPLSNLSRTELDLVTMTDTLVGRARLANPFVLAVEHADGPLPAGRVTMVIEPDLVREPGGQMWPADSALAITVNSPDADSSGDFEIIPVPSDSVPASYRLGCLSLAAPALGLWRGLAGGAPVRGVLAPGEYQLQLLADVDGDGRRDPGWPEPFRSSEAFWLLPDTLQIRARFTTEFHLPLPVKK
jgi:hypothetical protein